MSVCVRGKPCELGKGIMWKYSDKLRDLGPSMSEERWHKAFQLMAAGRD